MILYFKIRVIISVFHSSKIYMVYMYIYIITESRQGDFFLINSDIIYQNQHVELTLRLCFVHHVYIYYMCVCVSLCMYAYMLSYNQFHFFMVLPPTTKHVCSVSNSVLKLAAKYLECD